MVSFDFDFDFLKSRDSRKGIKWFTYNKNLVSIMGKGSMKEELQKVTFIIY